LEKKAACFVSVQTLHTCPARVISFGTPHTTSLPRVRDRITDLALARAGPIVFKQFCHFCDTPLPNFVWLPALAGLPPPTPRTPAKGCGYTGSSISDRDKMVMDVTPRLRRTAMAVLRPLVLVCLWRSNVAFLLAPPARLALGCWGRSTTSSARRVLPLRGLAADVPLRENFAPDVAVIAGAQAKNLAAHGAAIVFVPQARANLTVARDARSNPKPKS
jgi:hypothetical protein